MRVDLPKYQAYKPTDVEWIGDIPEGWEVRKLRRTARILRGKFTHRPRNDPRFYDGQYPFIQTGDVARASKYVAEYSQTLNDLGFSVSKQFPSGTLVMTIAANVGDIAILGFEACFPDSIVGFVPAKSVKVEYLFHVFTAMRQEFMSTATLGTQLNLNVDRISSITVPLPTVAEQTAILAFLDRETAKIDRLRAVRQKQVERLQEQRTAVVHHAVTKGLDPNPKIKPSGVEWLGEVPADWNVLPLWAIAKMTVSNVDKHSLPTEQAVRLCNYVDVYKNDRINDAVAFMEATASSAEIKKFTLRAGDVLITKDSENPNDIAVPAIVTQDVPSLVCGYHLAILRAYGDLLPEYMFRLLQTIYMRSYFATKAQGVTRFGLSQNDITRCLVPLPSIAVQQAIVAHIDRETAKLDTLIAKFQRELELLAEYRASLISHAVTGKIDVRGLVEPTPLEAA